MQRNLFKSLIVGFLALSSLTLAHGQGAEYATVTINNPLDITYRIYNYWQSGNGFFSQSNSIQSDQVLVVTGNFYPTGDPKSESAAGFTLGDPNNPNCIDSTPQQPLGHCYVAKFTYSKYTPKVEIWDNSQPCTKNCTIKYDPKNLNDISVTINTSK